MSLMRNTGNAGPQGLPVCGIDRSRAGGAVAAAEVIRADDAELAGVERLARADEAVPPAFVQFLGPAPIQAGHVAVEAGGVLAAGHRVEEQDDVRPVGVHPAVHFVGQGEAGQLAAHAQPQRILRVVELEETRGDLADGTSSSWARVAASGRRLQRLIQIGQDVVDVLQADAEADQFGRDAAGALLFLVELRMRRGGRVNRQALGVAHVGQVREELERIDELAARRPCRP